MLYHAYALSSMTEAFNEESAKLCSIFSRFDFPIDLINSTINRFGVHVWSHEMSWAPDTHVYEDTSIQLLGNTF